MKQNKVDILEPTKGDALIVVDVQNDFAHPDGSLYVSGASEIIPTIVKWIKRFEEKQLPIFFTMDWHPNGHISFDTWPKHCVRFTWGAHLHQAIHDMGIELDIVSKGEDIDKDQYSGFGYINQHISDLEHKLISKEINRLFIIGLATDYCVKATVLDGLNNGFEVVVVSNGVAGVNVNPGDATRALKEMEDAGAVLL